MDPFGAYLEYQFVPAKDKTEMPQCKMPIKQKHLSGAGVAHGGAVYSLVDYGFGAGMFWGILKDGESCSTVQLDMHYLAPCPEGSILTVTPKLLHRGRSLVRLEGKVHRQDGVCVAFASGTFNIYPRKGKLRRAMERFDRLHEEDPRSEELLYAHRMTAWLHKLAPDASEELQLAARAQHLCRWRIPRTDYPMDKAGYKRWRKDESAMHAELAGETLRAVGYEDPTVDRVQFLIRKKKIKADAGSQLIEDVASLVFLEFYFGDFAMKHADDKLVDILQKTWAKMSEGGHAAALALDLPYKTRALVERALSES